MTNDLYIVNSFTHNGSGGNGAGVMICKDDLSEKDMQFFAGKVGLSETAFIKKSNNDNYDYEVRFFTPSTEVELCGHATIAGFYTLAEKGFIDNSKDKVFIKQKTLSGILDVEVHFKNKKPESVLMTQASPKFLFSLDKKNSARLCSILNIQAEDIGINGYSLIPGAVSTGLADIMLPVKNLSVLKSIAPDFTALKDFSNELKVTGVHAFTLDTENKKSLAATRNFGPAAGINEESATGTSNGALCAYLIKNKVIDLKDTPVYFEQGYYMNNPSEIMCMAENDKLGNMIIKVGGSAVISK